MDLEVESLIPGSVVDSYSFKLDPGPEARPVLRYPLVFALGKVFPGSNAPKHYRVC
jgi:hypothetical protein